MVYLYALALGLPRRLAVRGIDGEPLRRFEAGEVIAIAGEIDRAPEPVEDALHTQDQVVRALHAKAEALLPARFGSTQPSEDALLAVLWRDRERLERALREVAGREQMTLRIFADAVADVAEPPRGWAEARAGSPDRAASFGPSRSTVPRSTGSIAEVAQTLHAEIAAATDALGVMSASGSQSPAVARVTPGAGTAYLERVRAREPGAPGLDAIRAAVGGLVHAERIFSASTPPLRATVYHLIDRGAAARYLEAVEAAALPPGIRLAASGPFPAYAFAPELAP